MTPIPDHILAIAERLRTQDNLATSHPAFCVQGYDKITSDDGYEYEWRNEEWELASEDEAAELDEYLDGHSEPRDGWTKVRFQEEWRTVMCCLTRKGAEDYIACDGHNLRRDGHDARIYVESFYRNQEMIQLREWLMTLTKDSQP